MLADFMVCITSPPAFSCIPAPTLSGAGTFFVGGVPVGSVNANAVPMATAAIAVAVTHERIYFMFISIPYRIMQTYGTYH
jgi:hypothetical protein